MAKILTKEMVLSKCKVIKLEDVKNLNLWGSEIENIDIIKKLVNVEVISLSVNKIKTLKPFSYCKKLTELYLRKNMISDIGEINNLKNCKYLKILWLGENPISLLKNYRQVTLYNLPSLMRLDNINVISSDKDIVNNMENDKKSVMFRDHLSPNFRRNENKIKNLKIERGFRTRLVEMNSINMTNLPTCNSRENSVDFSTKILITDNYLPVQNTQENIEQEYATKLQNLGDLTKLYTPRTENRIGKVKSKLFNKFYNNNRDFPPISAENITNIFSVKNLTFNHSLNGTSTNFPKYNNQNNFFIIKAIKNLLEEFNQSQLLCVRNLIEKKLNGESNIII